jgi:hypothetical protein
MLRPTRSWREKSGLPPEALGLQSEGWWSRRESNPRPLECHSFSARHYNTHQPAIADYLKPRRLAQPAVFGASRLQSTDKTRTIEVEKNGAEPVACRRALTPDKKAVELVPAAAIDVDNSKRSRLLVKRSALTAQANSLFSAMSVNCPPHCVAKKERSLARDESRCSRFAKRQPSASLVLASICQKRRGAGGKRPRGVALLPHDSHLTQKGLAHAQA